MTRYIFSIEDSKQPGYAPIELELSDDEAARVEAVRVIAGLARDALPDGDTRDFVARVADGEGKLMFEATLSFRSRWLASERS